MLNHTIKTWHRILLRRSIRAISVLEARLDPIITGWIVIMVGAGLFKILRAPIPPHGAQSMLATLFPYLLVCLAPVAGYRIASGSFPTHILPGQPLVRLAQFGRWRQLGLMSARRHPAYGPAGLLASLIIGLLLNIPVRTLELLAAMPALNAQAPVWARTMNIAMTGDVIVMNFFYAVCFVLALRSVPLFPRLLVFTWCMDIVMQFVIARAVTGAPGLPDAIRGLLLHLLQGNIDKVLISAFIWLPYLLLSERVNVTFRWRAARSAG
ncbi:MAG: DUF2569 domain-containing protein [Sphingomonadales bacterium]|nr:DUF2569 domain-containing protein [Sphingomonadales bacterium]MDE2169585.1 DUF2569 domain-containing protein [Sphingomonadales bacterium]